MLNRNLLNRTWWLFHSDVHDRPSLPGSAVPSPCIVNCPMTLLREKVFHHVRSRLQTRGFWTKTVLEWRPAGCPSATKPPSIAFSAGNKSNGRRALGETSATLGAVDPSGASWRLASSPRAVDRAALTPRRPGKSTHCCAFESWNDFPIHFQPLESENKWAQHSKYLRPR